MRKKSSISQQLRAALAALLDERGLHLGETASRWRKFVHFWVMVGRSFTRNRCPIRASALAYGTLLALIPMLAVVMSITSTFLKKQGEERINQFIGTLVTTIVGRGDSATSANPGTGEQTGLSTNRESAEVTNGVAITNLTTLPTNSWSTNQPESAASEDQKLAKAQKNVARKINEFIQNTSSGTLGLTGSVLLIFAGITMLSRIETTFNDIWGVRRGRSWFMRIVLYWGVLSLAPLLVVVAIGLATGSHVESTKRFVASLPLVGNFVVHLGFQLLPVVLLCLTFAAFYMLIPNTRVHCGAALVGGSISGVLFHLNNLVSVLYVSRVVSNSRIYGSLGMVPVFMIGLYFSWLILLFGAQVAYAYQNRKAYLEEKQVEQINQRGREFIGLRLMTLVAQRYVQGQSPPTVTELASELCVPSRLLQQLLQTLATARLVLETAAAEPAFVPARPLEQVTCHDILLALRCAVGQELETSQEPARAQVYGEFQRIQEAERQTASSITLLALVNRVQHQLPA